MARRVPGLLNGGRRYLAAILAAALIAPTLGIIVAPYQSTSVTERRRLQPPPTAPQSPADWAGLPRVLDAWLEDHFAWREVLVKAGLRLKANVKLGGPGKVQAVRGQGDWLLLSQGLLQASGAQIDAPGARRYAAFVCDLARMAKGRGETFLFAPAPAPVEIYPEALPDWAPRRSPNQSDLVLQDARACGAPALDLRPAMLAAKGGEKLFQHHDSHWTNAGALIAFNGVASALRQPWTIAPQSLNWRPGRPRDSDLVRLSGAVGLSQELAPEPPEGPDSPPGTGAIEGIDHGAFPAPFLIPGKSPRPVVLIVGDSYTSDFMGQYFRRAGVAMAWVHGAECRVDRRIFDKVRPDIVVVMPAAHEEICR